jgi:hypothetical protein
VIREWHAVNDDRNAITANSADIDSFCAKTVAGGLVIDPRHVTENITHGRGEVVVEIGSRHHGYISRDLANRPFVLVGDNNDLLDRLVGRECDRARQNASRD